MAEDNELGVERQFEQLRYRAVEALARIIILNEGDDPDRILEGAWTGSMGGHDPDFAKLKGGLATWWREKAATDPHPFTYCVRHLGKKFPHPERLCAWLKDQALGTTSWRKGKVRESAIFPPTIEELTMAIECFKEAEQEIISARASASPTAAQESEVGTGKQVGTIGFAEGKRIVTFTDGTTEVS